MWTEGIEEEEGNDRQKRGGEEGRKEMDRGGRGGIRKEGKGRGGR